jgi:hypothetical protein
MLAKQDQCVGLRQPLIIVGEYLETTVFPQALVGTTSDLYDR